MSTDNLHPVMQYGLRQSEAIACLRLQGHKQATVVLLYAAIDQMAWLSVDGEEAGNKGFKEWVQKYMVNQNHSLLSGASAADLWGARCGILHTGAPESNDFKNGKARRIYYSSNVGQVTTSEAEVLVLSLEWLGTAFACGLVFFLDDLKSDAHKDTNARAKLARMLIDQPV